MSCERVDSHLRFRALRFRLALVVWLDELAQRSDATVEVMPCGASSTIRDCDLPFISVHVSVASEPTTITGSPFFNDWQMFSDRFRYAFTVIHVVGRSFHCCVRLSKYRLVLAILNELAWGMPSLLNCVGLAPTYPVMVMRACCCAMIGPFCRFGDKGAAESTDEGARATCSRRNGL